ncbi:MAG TPA: DNA repair protein RadA [Actinomycetota bacterium]|nr:DNA repair protein RadA [Actinomycetota bacterium]
MHCSDCGYASVKWFGRCPDCGAWSSATDNSDSTERLEVVRLSQATGALDRFSTGLAELDRVLGGGLVRGEALLLAGEPGVGKSTLMLQLLHGLQREGRSALLATGEESLDQVALRARRLDLPVADLEAVAAYSVPAIVALSGHRSPDLLIVDSVQVLERPDLDQPAGSVTQVRECAGELVRHAKETGTVVVLVGQVTKEGTIAGPKTLEHMVDAVINLECERGGALRLLRTSKNRFGSCDEVGVFLMGQRGLEPVADPSAMFLADRRVGVTGSTVFPSIEGTRPVLVEIQALATSSGLPQPRRVPIGLDTRRLSLLLGVMTERTGTKLFASLDVFVAAAGGFTVREPAADLAVCLALYSALNSVPIDGATVAVGEVGLSGEVRRVPAMAARLKEAARLGFTTALVPRGVVDAPAGLSVVVVNDLAETFAHVDCTGHSERRGELVA